MNSEYSETESNNAHSRQYPSQSSADSNMLKSGSPFSEVEHEVIEISGSESQSIEPWSRGASSYSCSTSTPPQIDISHSVFNPELPEVVDEFWSRSSCPSPVDLSSMASRVPLVLGMHSPEVFMSPEEDRFIGGGFLLNGMATETAMQTRNHTRDLSSLSDILGLSEGLLLERTDVESTAMEVDSAGGYNRRRTSYSIPFYG
jgi:hypothetical protein